MQKAGEAELACFFAAFIMITFAPACASICDAAEYIRRRFDQSRGCAIRFKENDGRT